MGICWDCHWGMSKPVYDVYRRAVEELDESGVEHGPAHVVFADHNLDDHSIRSCIEECGKIAKYRQEGFTPAELARLRAYLEELLAIPEDVRDPCPEDYDGRHPEAFPPAVEMVRL